MKALLYVFVAAAGALTTIEAGANAKMTKLAGEPWWPAAAFTVINLICLLPLALTVGGRVPTDAAAKLPWWGWSGGVISAVYIVSTLIGPGRLGSGLFTGLTVTAAVLSSIALDNWGLVGFEVHPAGAGRLAGAALMVAGLILVAVF